ncbi:MAG: hypothetical protein ACI83I_000781 [Bacteroidia bacterium]|jgi:hypothetical protein
MNYQPLHIVIIAFNRPHCLERLCASLLRVTAFDENQKSIDLTISFDGGFDKESERIAEGFDWKFGSKAVRKHDERLKLDAHLLDCIISSKNHDVTLFLEDDHWIEAGYLQTISQYVESGSMYAGLSLYSYPLHPETGLPTKHLTNRGSFSLIQRISSRGLVLSSAQIIEFEAWLNSYDALNYRNQIPQYLLSYTDSQWETLYSKYLIQTNQFLAFQAENTVMAFGELGTHFLKRDDRYIPQNYLKYRSVGAFVPEEKPMKYDAWNELHPVWFTNLKAYDFEVDLNASKNNFQKEYLLTTRPMKDPILEFGLDLKPIEMNVIRSLSGTGIFFGKTKNVLPFGKFQRLKWRYVMRMYHLQRHSLSELMYHFIRRVFDRSWR